MSLVIFAMSEAASCAFVSSAVSEQLSRSAASRSDRSLSNSTCKELILQTDTELLSKHRNSNNTYITHLSRNENSRIKSINMCEERTVVPSRF